MAEATVPVLVLLCAHVQGREALERLADAGPGLVVRVVEGLCQRPEALQEEASPLCARRAVVALCRPDYPEVEFQASARRAGLDPLGLQFLNLGPSPGPEAVALLAGAVARARAYREAGPEGTKPVLLSGEGRLSRRALFTLPPIAYVPLPVVLQEACAVGEGCQQCVSACPFSALSVEGDAISLNRARCRSCGLCVGACPHRAIAFASYGVEEVEAQVNALLERGVRAILFACRRAPAPPGEGWAPVPVPCAGAVPTSALLALLARGVAVGLAGCGEGCAAHQGEAVQARVGFCRELLRAVGEEPERVCLIQAGRETAPPLTASPALEGGVRLFGKGVASGAVKALARDATALEMAHTASPLGVVVVDPEACTLCGTCATVCPTGALEAEAEGEEVLLTFDPSLCVACGECTASCPEAGRGAISLWRGVSLPALEGGRRPLLEDTQALCRRCGAPIASRRMLSRIAEVLGEDYAEEIMGGLCNDCRGFLPGA